MNTLGCDHSLLDRIPYQVVMELFLSNSEISLALSDLTDLYHVT
jgi:hypothetical protein